MAKLSFSNYQQTVSSSDNKSGVNFFTLKNDGDEALVRILHNSTEDFDICTVHPIETPADRIKFRNVNCLRTSTEPIENCPFCAAGVPLSNKFYIHMLQYTVDEKGQQVITPVIWERSMSYVYTIKSLIDEYGPLSNCIFKIKRSGAAGSRDTKYSILFGSPQVYPQERFPMLQDAFSNYSLLGHAVMNKPFQDMVFFLSNGSFPEVVAKTAEAAQPVMPPVAPQVAPTPVQAAAPVQYASAPYVQPAPTVAPAPIMPAATVPVTPSVTAPYPTVPQPAPTYTPNTGAKMPWEESTTAAPVKPNRYY